ncbi:phosphoglycerate kinase, partial [Mycolicibacterium porcinum]|uniref:phosphoglycerate kinase n=1 Tax=Mycolicibacterium porcinum TaxID=39693 RepID=UPI000A76FBE6
MTVKTLADLLAEGSEGVAGRGVLVRSDLNVPLDDEGNITDPGRIIASVPTLKALAEAGAKVVVTAHLGRPKGAPDPKLSLAPVAAALGEKLGRHVQLAGDVVGTDALARAEGLTDGDVLLLETHVASTKPVTALSWPPCVRPACGSCTVTPATGPPGTWTGTSV